MKKKTKQPKHGDVKLTTIEVKTPYASSKIEVPVQWDKEVGEWMATPEGMHFAECEKARLILESESVDVQVGHDPKDNSYWLSVTPPCFRSTTTIFDLTEDDLIEIYLTIQSFIHRR